MTEKSFLQKESLESEPNQQIRSQKFEDKNQKFYHFS
jgi:hypothetical protein